MYRRLIRAMLVAAFFGSMVWAMLITTDTKKLEDVRDTEVTEITKESEDEVTVISLTVSPKVRVARITYEVKTDKSQEEVEGIYGIYPVGLFGVYSVPEIIPIEGGYRIVCRGIYDNTIDELETQQEFQFYDNDELMDVSHVHSSQMEMTVVEEKHFEVSDENGYVFHIDISKIGVCILPEQEWQEDARRAYVIMDLKDKTSRLLTNLPAVNPVHKKYQVDPPEEVQDLEEKESQIEELFIEWGAAHETENCGLRLAAENEIEVDQIENVRLIMQELQE